MSFLRNHISQCFVAGIVALLPIVGIVVTIVYFENLVADSWLNRQGFYFFGMGLLIAVAITYLVGLFFSNVIGKWIWKTADRILDRLPVLGNLYQTLKQLLGYGEGEDAMFQRVVYVRTKEFDGEEIGLVTNENCSNEIEESLAVFLPFSPSPMNGRLIFIHKSKTRPADMTVNQALKSIVSLGTILDESPAKRGG